MDDLYPPHRRGLSDGPDKERASASATGRLAGTAGIALAANIAQQAAMLAIVLLAARYLVPAEYGVYTLAIVFVNLVQTLTYTGLFHFLVTGEGDERTILDTTFWLIVGSNAVCCGALVVLSPMIGSVFDAPDIAWVLAWLAVAQIMEGFIAWNSGVLMRRARIRANFTAMLIQNVGALAAGVALLVVFQSLFALVAARFARIAFGVLLYAVAQPTRPGLAFSRDLARHVWSYASNLYGTRALNFLSLYGADIALGLTFSTSEAGLYRFGNRLATAAMDIVGVPLRHIALARFGTTGRNAQATATELKRFASTKLLLLTCAAAAIMVFVDDAVGILFQPEYAAAVGVAYALAVRGVTNAGNQFVEPIMASRGETGAVMRHHTVWTGAQIVVLFAAPTLGLIGLAWAQAAMALVASIAAFRLIASRGIAVRPALSDMGQVVGLALAYGGAIVLIEMTVATGLGGVPAFALAVALSGVLALALLALAARRNVFDLRIFAG